MDKKVFFITVVDMYDQNGNGGVKGSQRNLLLLQKCFGKENVILATFPRKEYTLPPLGAITFKRTKNNFEYLIAALFGCKVYFPWYEKEIFKYINHQKIDMLFIDSSMLGRMARIDGNYKKVVFFHNVEAYYALNKVKNEGIKFLPSYWASKRNEVKAMKYADRIICLNERDANTLKLLYRRTPDYILPVTLTDSFDEERYNNAVLKKNCLLFVGALMPQNQISVEWFIERIMSGLPEVTLDIVGKGFDRKKDEYEKNSNVNVIGEVDDLGEYYYSHPIVVLPIQYGAGMKIKTAEAMMYGRIIIGSDEAFEGYEVNGADGIYRCNSAEEYICRIKEELTGENLNLGKSRLVFLKKYETEKVLSGFQDFINVELEMG